MFLYTQLRQQTLKKLSEKFYIKSTEYFKTGSLILGSYFDLFCPLDKCFEKSSSFNLNVSIVHVCVDLYGNVNSSYSPFNWLNATEKKII